MIICKYGNIKYKSYCTSYFTAHEIFYCNIVTATKGISGKIVPLVDDIVNAVAGLGHHFDDEGTYIYTDQFSESGDFG